MLGQLLSGRKAEYTCKYSIQKRLTIFIEHPSKHGTMLSVLHILHLAPYKISQKGLTHICHSTDRERGLERMLCPRSQLDRIQTPFTNLLVPKLVSMSESHTNSNSNNNTGDWASLHCLYSAPTPFTGEGLGAYIFKKAPKAAPETAAK